MRRKILKYSEKTSVVSLYSPPGTKEKHNQNAHVEPRTLPITRLVQTCPRWESSQWGVCEFRTSECKGKQCLATTVAIMEVQGYNRGDVPDVPNGRQLLRHNVLTSQKSPQSKKSRIEISFCNVHPFAFLRGLK